jgi:multidrug efflux system membrane fusion protein
MKLKLKKWQLWTLIIVLAIFLYQISGYLFLYCNDAYVEADLIPITPRVSGYLQQVPIHNNEHVKKGQLLLQIDPTPFQLQVEQQAAALQQAQAQLQVQIDKVQSDEASLAVAKDQLAIANTTLNRYVNLAEQQVIDQQTLNNQQAIQKSALANVITNSANLSSDQRTLAVVQAQVNNAKSALDLAKYNLSLTTITAPADGYLNHMLVYPGTHVTQDTPVFGLVSDNTWRVVANYKEGALAHLRPGQTAWVMLSTDLWHITIGKVKSYGRAVARDPSPADAALPYIEPTTDWIRYPYRFPVTIALPDQAPDSSIAMGADVRTLIWVP